jgi:predicted metal-binding membrane protein
MTYPESDPERTRALPGQEPAYQANEEVVREQVEDPQAKRLRTVRMVCSGITFICALFAVVLVTQIILVLAEANPRNGFASFIDGFSSAVSLGFDGLFTPNSAKAAVLFNYGAAAIVWLLISAALTYLIRKFALPGPRREVTYRRRTVQ